MTADVSRSWPYRQDRLSQRRTAIGDHVLALEDDRLQARMRFSADQQVGRAAGGAVARRDRFVQDALQGAPPSAATSCFHHRRMRAGVDSRIVATVLIAR